MKSCGVSRSTRSTSLTVGLICLKNSRNEESDIEDDEPESTDYPKLSEYFTKKIEHETERVKLMRQSNFGLKSKIDILYDILQTQKEKHYDLKQELNRMLSDV